MLVRYSSTAQDLVTNAENSWDLAGKPGRGKGRGQPGRKEEPQREKPSSRALRTPARNGHREKDALVRGGEEQADRQKDNEEAVGLRRPRRGSRSGQRRMLARGQGARGRDRPDVGTQGGAGCACMTTANGGGGARRL